MASSIFQRNKHSPSSVIRFFKIGLGKSLEDGNLKVPKKFSKKYGDGVPNPVYLKPPDGTAWKIDWSEYDGAILFENGWKEFASYYSLDNCHMLLFQYNKTSDIEVHIHDMSGLEIVQSILHSVPSGGWSYTGFGISPPYFLLNLFGIFCNANETVVGNHTY